MASTVTKISQDSEEDFADELKPGTELLHGQYTIEEFLNSGGFGITYLAKDSLDRRVVIKECFPGSLCRRSEARVGARSRAHQAEFKSVIKLFVQEAKSMAKLKHPNIVGVHQVFEDNDTAYMALDYVDGFDLLETLEEGGERLPPEEITQILRKILGAVEYLHGQNILHRDISPDNILVNKKNSEPLLIDFGAAREEVSKASRVLSALRVVKDGYSPQEFYVNGSKQGPSSDLYALAATFYHLIVGEMPPDSQTRLAALAAEEDDPYVPLEGRIEGYDAPFLAAIDKALKVLPKDRIQSAKEWMEMISAGVSELRAGASASKPEVATAKESEKSGSKKLLLTTALVVVAAGAGFAAWQNTQTDPVVTTPAVTTPVISADATAPEPVSVPVDVTDEPVETVDTVTQPAVVDTMADVDPGLAAAVSGGEMAAVEATDTAVEASGNDEIATAEEDTVAPAPEEVVNYAFDVSTDTLPTGSESGTELDEAEQNALAAASDNAALPTPDALDIQAALDRLAGVEATPVEPEVTVPTEPEVAAPVETGLVEDTAAVQEPEQPAELPKPEIKMVSSVVLPFSAAGDSSTLITNVKEGAPVWMQPGQRISEVNSQPIKSFAEIDPILRRLVDLNAKDTATVVFSIVAFPGATPIQKTVDLKVLHDLVLPNGLKFRVVETDDGQTSTKVIEAPEIDGGMMAGDIVVSYMATDEQIGVDASLQEIMQREVANDVLNYSFVVLRDGKKWITPFDLSESE